MANKGRPPGVVVKALTLDAYAVELLREMAPSTKAYGHFLSALIYAEHARRMERASRKELVHVVVGESMLRLTEEMVRAAGSDERDVSSELDEYEGVDRYGALGE